MDERAALFASILENPSDPLPRLVFADWLEEHGEAERAAFIRLGCELATSDDDDPRIFELAVREREMLDGQREQWTNEFPESLRPRCGFRMGFVHHLSLTGAEWAEHAAAMCAVTPIESIDLRGDIDEAAQAPATPFVRRLSLISTYVSGERFFRLLASPLGDSLRELNLSYHSFGDDRAAALLRWQHLPLLESLEAARHFLGPTGVDALIGSRLLDSLRLLDLSDGPLDVQASRRLAMGELPTLRVLRLKRCDRLGAEGIRYLFAAHHLRQLQELSLLNTPASDVELSILATGPLESLTVLRLSGFFSREGVQQLALATNLSRLRVLELWSQRLDDACCVAIGRSPIWRNLRELSLPASLVSDRAALELAYSEHLPALRMLRIPKGGLTDSTLEMLRERFGPGLQLLTQPAA